MAKLLRSGFFALLAIGFVSSVRAEVAVLETVADSGSRPGSGKAREIPMPGVAFLKFNASAASGWRWSSATLLLHLNGDTPATVEAALIPEDWTEMDTAAGLEKKCRFTVHRVFAEGEGWIRIRLNQPLASQLAGSPHGLALRIRSRTSVHTRESASFSPYLVVEGSRE